MVIQNQHFLQTCGLWYVSKTCIVFYLIFLIGFSPKLLQSIFLKQQFSNLPEHHNQLWTFRVTEIPEQHISLGAAQEPVLSESPVTDPETHLGLGTSTNMFTK